MAGIGFELRKLLQKDSYTGLLQAYLYAGVISAGPWVLSILGILVIGFLSLSVVVPSFAITQFQVSVTYLMVASLVATGPIQLAFTRFIADRLFERKDALVMPNFNGVLLLVTTASGVGGIALAATAFAGLSDFYRILMITGFVILCDIWVATIFLSGMKRYVEIVSLYALGYAITVVSAVALRPLGMEGLLLGFVIGHFVLLTGMITLVLRNYPSATLVSFQFLERGAMYPSLMASGFMFHFAVWVDKLMFWYTPSTSQQVIGPLRASLIYDLPIFLAYLAIIPGMAVFLVRIETDFAEYFQKFYDAVRGGGSLDTIDEMREEMVFSIRQGLAEIVKIQGIAVLVVFAVGPSLLPAIGISTLYLPLLYVNVVAAGLQVVLLGLLTVFYYLDKRGTVVVVCSVFLAANLLLTAASLRLGAAFYGYGFALSLLITVVVAMRMMEAKLYSLEYETFMLQ